MGKNGYIYVLANSAMPGLIKVGKTQRSPSERAQELSSFTATPTPFIVVYEHLFTDCDAAENYVHTMLQKRGLRESTNREFFRALPKDVIEIIISAPGNITELEAKSKEIECDDFLTDNVPDELDEFTIEDDLDSYPWWGIWEEAENAYYGHGDTIQDYDEALELYVHAARLKCPMANRRIGYMYELGEGVSQSKQKALEFYKKGVRDGDYYCYINMASMYLRSGDFNNQEKALKLLIKSKLEKTNHIIEKEEKFINAIGMHILTCFYQDKFPPISFAQNIASVKELLLLYMNAFLEHSIKINEERIKEALTAAIVWIEENVAFP